MMQEPMKSSKKELLFGRYYYHADSNELLPIEWLPLTQTNTATLCLAKNIIDMKPFLTGYWKGEKRVGLDGKPYLPYWSRCSLREWLNTEFLAVAFTDNELRRILPTEHGNEAFWVEWSQVFVDEKDTVTDRVFLLNEMEVGRYVDEDNLFPAITPYAAIQSDDPSWWIRKGGFVGSHGGLSNYDDLAVVVTDIPEEDIFFPTEAVVKAGVRPALWLMNDDETNQCG